jgi:hypothetical protein
VISRITDFALTFVRQTVPIGGVVAGGWHPITAVSIYWLESVLLALAATTLCALMQRRASAADIADARAAGDAEALEALQSERAAIERAHLSPLPVLLFHGGSLIVFGFIAGMLMLMMVQNGRITEPLEWGEVRDGAVAMTALVAAGLLVDLWRFDRLPLTAVESRVNSCLARWVLFWMLGFFGIWIIILTGRTMWFFALFSGIKLLFESWAGAARMFGWRSLKDRGMVS